MESKGGSMDKALQEKMFKLKSEIDGKARWLREAEEVEIPFADFEETKTERRDKRTGNAYTTTDYKIAIRLAGGKVAYRLVNQYVLSEIIEGFKNQGMPSTLIFRRTSRPVR